MITFISLAYEMKLAMLGLTLTRSMDHICPWKRHYPQINGPYMVFYVYKRLLQTSSFQLSSLNSFWN